MPFASVTVVTLKGGALGRAVLMDYERDTVACLKDEIASRLNGSASDMKLVFNAKPLSDETMVLSRAGIRGDCKVHVVYRVHGGSPAGVTVSLRRPVS